MKFEALRTADIASQKEFSRVALGEIQALRRNTSQNGLGAESLRKDTAHAVEVLIQHQKQSQLLLHQCVQQSVTTNP